MVKPDFVTIKTFAADDPNWREGALRWIVLKRETNGFKACLRKVGRKVLIDRPAFYAVVNDSAAH